jgi:hypothetical protein
MPEFYRIFQRAFSKIPFTNEEGKKRDEKEMRKRALLYFRLGLVEEIVKKSNFFFGGSKSS